MSFAGEGLSGNLSGMSKNQLYDIMYQMKTLIEQNRDQAKDILVQNPQLTKVLFQAQILLGMVKPSQPAPNNPPAALQHPQQSKQPPQQSNAPAASTLLAPYGVQDQANASQAPNFVRKANQHVMPVSSPSVPSINTHSKPLPSHPSQSVQQMKGHFNAQATPTSLPQSNQIPNMRPPQLHSASQQQHSLQQHPMSTSSTQSQQPMRVTHMQLQPPLPPQPRPPTMPAFGQQVQSHMGPYAGFQHSGAPQMHQSQPMYHSGQNHPSSMGPSYSQGHPPLPAQPHPQSMYQGGGGQHSGMEFRQAGNAMQTERGSSWIPGIRENTSGTQQVSAPTQQFIGSQMGPGSQPAPPAAASPEVEAVLLQQVMNLTPEQINHLPSEQRTQVLQLQQMLRR